MIVVDGDSVAENRVDNWPVLLGAAMQREVRNISAHQSTTKHILRRMDYADSLKPTWYVVCIGQWSCKNEEMRDFESGTERIVRAARERMMRPCLVTPPFSIVESHWTAAVVRRIAHLYNVPLVDFHRRMSEDGADASWFFPEEIPCHLNGAGAHRVLKYFEGVL